MQNHYCAVLVGVSTLALDRGGALVHPDECPGAAFGELPHAPPCRLPSPANAIPCVLCLHQLLIMALPCVTAVYLARGHRKSKCYWVYFWTAADHVDGVAEQETQKKIVNITHTHSETRAARTHHAHFCSLSWCQTAPGKKPKYADHSLRRNDENVESYAQRMT